MKYQKCDKKEHLDCMCDTCNFVMKDTIEEPCSSCINTENCYCHAGFDSMNIKELDPYGKDQHETGSKLCYDKPEVNLMFTTFPRALMEVAKVSTYGAKKYTPYGCLSVPNGEQVYMDALGRHLLKLAIEGSVDSDSLNDIINNPNKKKIYHKAQIAWNALISLELELKDKEKQND